MKKFVLPEQNDPIWDPLKTAASNFDFKRTPTISLEVPKNLRTSCIDVEDIDLDYGHTESGQFLVVASLSVDLLDNPFLNSDGLLFQQEQVFEFRPEWDELYSVIGSLFAQAFRDFAVEVDELYQSAKDLQEAMRIQHEQL